MNHTFHGRSLGALSLTHKIAYRQPFGPSAVGVTFIAPEDPDASASKLEQGDVSGASLWNLTFRVRLRSSRIRIIPQVRD